MKSIGILIVTFASLLGAGCQTMSMDAKATRGNQTEVGTRQGGTCARVMNSRSECDDRVGCFWNDESAQCSSH